MEKRNGLSALHVRYTFSKGRAILTFSATYFYAGKAIPIAGLTTPKVFVTADSVTRGKPFPDPYLLGAAGCNASPFECECPKTQKQNIKANFTALVVEDAPTGIRSGKASGARVLATCTSHEREELEKERPDFLVDDLSHVTASWDAETNTFKLIIEQPVDRVQPKATPDVTPVVTPAGSRVNSFAGGGRSGFFGKGSDELTGNDSVVGSPVPSRPGSPGAGEESGADISRRPSQQGVTLDAFKRAFAGNAKKNRNVELDQDE